MDKVPCREGIYPQTRDVTVDVLELCLKLASQLSLPAPWHLQPRKKSVFVSKESPDEQETREGREKGIPTAVTVLGRCIPAPAIPGSLQWQWLVVLCSSTQRAGGEGKAGRTCSRAEEEACRGESPWLCNPASPSAHPAQILPVEWLMSSTGAESKAQHWGL